MKLTLIPASGTTLSRETPITQAFKIENTQFGVKTLALRIKLSFVAADGLGPVEEQFDVKNFPAGF
jgi:hypothetical protein